MNKDLKVTCVKNHPLLNVASSDKVKRDKAIVELRKTKEGKDVLDIVARIIKAEIKAQTDTQ